MTASGTLSSGITVGLSTGSNLETVGGALKVTENLTSIDSLAFDTAASITSAAGKMFWDGQGTVNLGLGGGNVSIALGQEVVNYVTNAESTTLNVGEVVYLYGASGDRPSVKRASNISDATSSKTFGIVAESIGANQAGFVMNRGIVQKINTAAYSPGDVLWLGATAGTFTITKPVAPNHLVFVGVVLRANAGNGLVFVSPQNGYELDEIHDVLIASKTNGDVLTYESSTGLWKNKQPATAGTVTSITASSPLTGGTITSSGSIGIDQTALTIAESQVTNLTTDLAAKAPLASPTFTGTVTIPAGASISGYASLTAANAFTVGGHTITAEGATVKPLILKGAASQTANLQEWQDSAGTILGFLSSIGNVAFASRLGLGVSSFSGGVGLFVNNTSATITASAFRGASSQTADLLQIQNSAATVLGGRNALAQIYSGSTSTITSGVGGATTAATGTGTTATLTLTSASNAAVGDLITVAGVTPTGYNGTYVVTAVSNTSPFTVSYANATTAAQTVAGTVSLPAQASITARSAGTKGLVVRGASSQSANLQEWQDSTGSVGSYVSANGSAHYAAQFLIASAGNIANNVNTAQGTIAIPTTGVKIATATAANVSLTVQNTATTPTGDLTQWLNTGGTVVAKVLVGGAFSTTSTVITPSVQDTTGTGPYLSTGVNTFFVLNRTTATNIPLVVRGMAAQSGNLQQWQDATPTVLTAITSAGTINFASGNTSTTATAGAITAPALVTGFITMQIAGTTVKVPYYSN